jgi:DNA-directed RNA polymerase specialized sigma24 family protein
LILKYVEEIGVSEIARILRISEHAVESRLARARKALRQSLREE